MYPVCANELRFATASSTKRTSSNVKLSRALSISATTPVTYRAAILVPDKVMYSLVPVFQAERTSSHGAETLGLTRSFRAGPLLLKLDKPSSIFVEPTLIMF